MQPSSQQLAFLAKASSFNERFNAIRLDPAISPLRHSFWTSKEIADAQRVSDDWNVSVNLTPFYGDWHDLICLDVTTDRILFLNENRQIVHSWNSIDEFTQCLECAAENPNVDNSGIVDVWLSPRLKSLMDRRQT